ncbi:hypothetical protein BSZ31_09810 [Limnobacter sp. SAORIC-690]|nr:hypothetical protein BSZ31_09810 [Limnobacter sp. SAORIC-690]
MRAEQGRCCPAWATENGPDPQFRRAVLRHRKAQQGINKFSGERAKSKPIELPRKLQEIGTQADRAVNAPREIGTQSTIRR